MSRILDKPAALLAPAIRGDSKRQQLDLPSRILAVADVYEALTADRPYRAGMSREDALAIIDGDRGSKLCGTAIDALETHSLDVEGL